MTSTTELMLQARSIFPNLQITADGERADRSLAFRRIGQYALTLLRAPASSVDAIGRMSNEAGMGEHLKLIWQLDGTMRYEDQDRALDLRGGDMLVTAMGADYRLEMGESHEALVLMFDPGNHPHWTDLAARSLGMVVPEIAATATAAAGARMLLSGTASDASAEQAVEAMIDLALKGASPDGPAPAAIPPLIARARLQVARNIADPTYDPDRLARDLGMSRRSLYARLADHGVTPGRLIRGVRLDGARRDLAAGDGRSILSIALANGFADGACLSRLFRAAFGETPTCLRGRSAG